MAKKNIPSHIAIIMDGNGRWAKMKGKHRISGHRKGVESVRKVINYSSNIGVKYLTLFTFSTENWKRPKREVNTLMKMFEQLLNKEIPELYKNNVKVRFLGRRDRLPKKLIEKMENAEEKTADNTGLTLIFAIDYGGRQEIIDAVKKICYQHKNGNEIDEDEFSKYLYLPDIPSPDLVIRTANEMRISNFLIWEIAYSELYITKVLWPDFDEKEMDKALLEYSKRERKFGKVIK